MKKTTQTPSQFSALTLPPSIVERYYQAGKDMIIALDRIYAIAHLMEISAQNGAETISLEATTFESLGRMIAQETCKLISKIEELSLPEKMIRIHRE